MRCIERWGRAGCLGLGLIAGCGPRPLAPPPEVAPLPATTTRGAAVGAAAARTWSEWRVQAARRLMAANPQITYAGAVPDPLLAIPVLEIELNADGSVRNIDVMRMPTQARETVQIAIDAVRRAAPFGDVSRLPKPWKFSETFLFNDDRKFKPRTLDR